ncbi:MAG TPA: SRPBCC family protein [Polyangia bacterium]|jgi:ligand-binding SRPBCC domain-containing protein|nr:SRPBCC family protein [Polyangia bacterium]
MSYVLEREQFVPRRRPEVFAFFADAANLERLTPPTLRFSILTPEPIEMRPGTVIDYRLSLLGVPFRWRTLIETFEPEARFVDVQESGPYKLWRHTHTFEDAPGGTLIRDRVEYELPFGPLGHLARAIFVQRQLAYIFDYRREAIGGHFGDQPVTPGPRQSHGSAEP